MDEWNGELPTRWTTLSDEIKDKDNRCTITGDMWFPALSWTGYQGCAAIASIHFNDINSPHNVITLRSDLSEIFVEGHVLLVPYDGRIITSFVTRGTRDLAHMCHFRNVEIPDRFSAAYLYMRFAWNIFKLTSRQLGIAAGIEGVVTIEQPTMLGCKQKRRMSQKKDGQEGDEEVFSRDEEITDEGRDTDGSTSSRETSPVRCSSAV
ncbi:hypothetical protein DXG03_004103 [Asterophora parasitica]|uniref:HNH nuclease domain-containing protein n=1 Tax=Asterophora parasitica TaxID=117018 RepID=A0A9P7G0X3_9AGAR|nr:hypothetical protein DXG03_004103 [Asterophora parasitica]